LFQYRSSRLFQQVPDNNEPQDDSSSTNDGAHDYSQEEILLRIRLSVVNSGDSTTVVSREQALDRMQRYTQSFPFAAVLPVQPLTYQPVYGMGGVDISFLRKKTDLKSGMDGGLRFFIETTNDANDNGILITVKRNSSGQAIRKMIAEKLVVTQYVAGLTGHATDNKAVGGPSPVTDKVLQVTSLFHKWME
jgi:hypothetical protein